ncbi:hypothetical protein ACSNN7_02170 [Micromonospora sp. URMC 105]|uniref:hypothetical protein n=1 Tax=Micromonospora sp. URMC 105 TaxID=3423413 RepID=UPI003F19962D
MRPSILFVTDLAYPAQGRRYGDEDVYLTSRLREDFDLALCHPREAAALMGRFDAVVVRNSGPVLAYREAYEAFRAVAPAGGVRVSCRTADGALLLVELEDLNPYLSLDLVGAPVREQFVAALTGSLRRFLAAG